MATREQVAEILRRYSKVFSDFRLDADGIELYSTYIGKYSAERIDRAMGELVVKCKFFPKIAEIVETINRMTDRQLLRYGSPEWEAEKKKREKVLKGVQERVKREVSEYRSGENIPRFYHGNAEEH